MKWHSAVIQWHGVLFPSDCQRHCYWSSALPGGSLASNRSDGSRDKDTDITAGVLVVALVQQIGYGAVDTSDHLPSC